MGFCSILATASHTAMSMVPMATERSPWPPGFSLVNMQFQILCGSRLLPLSSTRLAGSAVGIEAVADHRLAIADDVGDHCHQAQRHLAEVDIGVADGGADRDGFFADFNDAHGSSPGSRW